MPTANTTGTDLFIKVGDVKICYTDLGIGTTPIIFIHGFPFDKSTWQPQLDFLSTSYRVIAYDIRGYGQSEKGAHKASINLFATDLVAFMDALNIEKAIVCGLSMGGYILMNACKENPERFAAIILSDTQCIADSEETKAGRNKAITLIKAGGIVDFTEGFVKKIFTVDTIANNTELVNKITDVILLTSTDTITDSLAALAEREEMCTSLDKINVPAMILCGADDVVTPLEQARFLQRNISDANLYIISKAAHLSNLEQPSDFNNHLLRFVLGVTGKN